MIRRFQLSLLLCLLLLAGMGKTAVSPAVAQSGTAYQVFQLVNGFRAGYGLPPLQANSALSAAAQNQANYMAAHTIFSSHTGEGGSTPQSRANAFGYVGYVSENIVGGTGMTPNQGLIWWENSPVHYNTLVTTRYIEAGTGYATNGSENFYVLVVGRPSDAPPSNNPSNNSPAPLFVTPIQLSEPGEDGSIIHTLQEGQALWSLAAHYEVSLADLMLFNNLAENAILHPGDKVIIRLAEGQEPPPTPTPPLTHVVREGENAWVIAARYKLKLTDFFWLNGLDENSYLQPGEEVTVRLAEGQAPPPTPTPIVIHTIRSGQTLWDVALTYGISLDDLLAFNGLSADAILQVGQELRVRPPDPPTPTPTAAPPTAVSLPTTTVSLAITTPIPVERTAVPTLPAAMPTPTPTIGPSTTPTDQTGSNSVVILAVGLTIAAGALIVIGRRL